MSWISQLDTDLGGGILCEKGARKAENECINERTSQCHQVYVDEANSDLLRSR